MAVAGERVELLQPAQQGEADDDGTEPPLAVGAARHLLPLLRPPPTTPLQYIRELGPGLVMALTWLGAGDLVDSAVAGGDYGYALTWAMAMAFFVRFVFVSLLAKFQLHKGSVIEGLAELHPAVAAITGLIAITFGHANNSYMIRGVGETSTALSGVGSPTLWSVGWMCAATLFLFRAPKEQYARVEKLFYVLLAVLTLSLIGVALWTGPDAGAMLRGLLLFEVPAEQSGDFSVLLVVVSLIGAIGGSIANFLYPSFIHEKGWRGPEYRRVQMCDLAFGTTTVVLLDLAVWTIGAEVLHPGGERVTGIDELATLLTISLGPMGGPVFYLGCFSALLSSVVGNASGYGLLVAEVTRVLGGAGSGGDGDRRGAAGGGRPPPAGPAAETPAWRATALWCLISPLIWSLPGMPNFVTLTVLVNAVNVVVLPFLTVVIWLIAWRAGLMEWYEHVVMIGLFVLALWGTYQSVTSLAARE
jgi:Mn2+/Fe2+ NRAMP family transporter